MLASEERTTTSVIRGLAEQKTPVSPTSVKNWLRDLEEMGLAVKRESEDGGKKVHHWRRIDAADGAR